MKEVYRNAWRVLTPNHSLSCLQELTANQTRFLNVLWAILVCRSNSHIYIGGLDRQTKILFRRINCENGSGNAISSLKWIIRTVPIFLVQFRISTSGRDFITMQWFSCLISCIIHFYFLLLPTSIADTSLKRRWPMGPDSREQGGGMTLRVKQ